MRYWWAATILVAGAALAGGAWWERRDGRDPAAEERTRRLESVVATVQRESIDSIDGDLYAEAAKSVVASLGDPYSELLTGESYLRYRRQVTGEDVVLGAIAAPGAGRGALAPGDEILEIDGRSTAGWSRAAIERALKGPPGSKLTVVVRPRGADKPVRRILTRTVTHVPATSPVLMLTGEIGYVALRAVSEGSAEELRRALDELAMRGMTALVLDLRRNPGGLIKEGVDIAELFLQPGDTVGVARGRSPQHTRIYVADRRPIWPTLPLVVVVDGTSASAAELIAGALQDHDRAVVVGAPTFGKGVLQTTYPMDDDVALKITTARWFTPSGRSIQRNPSDSSGTRRPDPRYRSAHGRALPDSSGIVPDVPVPASVRPRGERTILKAVGGDLELFRSIVAEHVRARLAAGASVVGGEADREALRRRLAAGGFEISVAEMRSAAPYVDRELELETIRQRQGDEHEAVRRALADRQIETAVRLLRGADDPADVLRAANRMRTARLSSASSP